MRIRKVPRAWLDDPGSIPTGRPGPGDLLGAQGVAERFARSSELLGPDAMVHITDVLASDSRAAVLFEVRDRGTRGSCAQRVAVYRLSRGRITEIRSQAAR